MQEQHGPVAKEVKRRLDLIEEAVESFTNITAPDGDDFSGWNDQVIIRTEITAGELRALREAKKQMQSLRLWAMLGARGYDEATTVANSSR
jgi:hypothetical protein